MSRLPATGTRRAASRAAGCSPTTQHRALDAVSAASGAVPRLYRPPHGVFTFTGLRLIHDFGLRPLLWSRWGRDWERRATAATIADHATAALRAGDVMLLHDAGRYSADESWRATAAALPRFLTGSLPPVFSPLP